MSDPKYLRALIDAHRAFADTLEARLAEDVESKPANDAPAPPPSASRARPRRAPRALPRAVLDAAARVESEPNDLEAAAARGIARRRGILRSP